MASHPTLQLQADVDVRVRVLDAEPVSASRETREWLDKFPLPLGVVHDPGEDDPLRASRQVEHSFAFLARELAEELPEGEAKAAAFGKLLEAKEWALQALRAAAAA